MAEIEEKVENETNDTVNTAQEYTQADKDKNKTMAILSYILPFIPYFAEKESKWVRYHSVQGMNLLVVSIAYAIAYNVLTSIIQVNQSSSVWGIAYSYKVTPWWVTFPLSLIGIGITVLAIMGIVNVCNGKAEELPIVSKVKIFK